MHVHNHDGNVDVLEDTRFTYVLFVENHMKLVSLCEADSCRQI